MNGVDNGKLWFDHVRVPRENLLDAYSQVDKGGAFHSKIAGARGRFLAVADQLLVTYSFFNHDSEYSDLRIFLEWTHLHRIDDVRSSQAESADCSSICLFKAVCWRIGQEVCIFLLERQSLTNVYSRYFTVILPSWPISFSRGR